MLLDASPQSRPFSHLHMSQSESQSEWARSSSGPDAPAASVTTCSSTTATLPHAPHRASKDSRSRFKTALVRADLEPMTLHYPRHTAASLAVAAGANVKAIQRMLGHASAAMTLDIYSDLFDDDLDALGCASIRQLRPRVCAKRGQSRSPRHEEGPDSPMFIW